MELKDRLQILLDEQNIKRKDFASTIKVTEGYVSNILNGKRSLNWLLAKLPLVVFDVSSPATPSVAES